MSKVLHKSKFLKYSLLTSISIGAVITVPFEAEAFSFTKSHKPKASTTKSEILTPVSKLDFSDVESSVFYPTLSSMVTIAKDTENKLNTVVYVRGYIKKFKPELKNSLLKKKAINILKEQKKITKLIEKAAFVIRVIKNSDGEKLSKQKEKKLKEYREKLTQIKFKIDNLYEESTAEKLKSQIIFDIQANKAQQSKDRLVKATEIKDTQNLVENNEYLISSLDFDKELLALSDEALEIDTNFAKEMSDLLNLEATEEIKKHIVATAPTTSAQNNIVKSVHLNLKARLNLEEPVAAVAAGDEESHIQRGLWIRNLYGISNQGRVDNIDGYRGINKGGTIGFDFAVDNNIIGVAYSNIHSIFKFKNNTNNDKEIINSHVVSIYGQKELPKNFVAQVLVSASKNFIKNKTTYLLDDNKFKSKVKHRNHTYNAEAFLNYKRLTKNNLIITPNIGLRYGKSRDGVYNEVGPSIQEIALTAKENNIFSGIIGTKVKIPLKNVSKLNNLVLTLHGSVEHNFKENTQVVNRVIHILDNKFTQSYVIPKQPKMGYNLGSSIVGSIKNTTVSLEYNYYLNKHYQSHQGSIKLKVNL